MSLKAKIEAVIYASEEPVTLAQLTGLLGEEAQAELDALADRQQSLALDESANDTPEADPDALNAEVLEDTPVADSDTPVADADTPAADDGEVEPKAPETAPKAPETDAKLREASRVKERRLREYFRSLLDQLIADYASDARGLEIREVAGGFRLATKPEYHDAVRGFVKSLKPPLKLSLQALETLAVVAYKQPVTAPEVSEIRGVDSAGVLGSLMARKLINPAGRKQVIGRPILYKTTKDFLLRFGLKDIQELPSIEEFEKMAGELNAAVQEEIPMDAAPEERDERVEDEKGSEEEGASGSATSLDEANATPEPTNINHDTPEDLMSDDSTYLEGHNREHADVHEVEPGIVAGAESGCEAQPGDESELRAEDGDASEISENIADEAVIDGRISGPPPSYADDSPSAEEARDQEEQHDEEHR